MLSPGSRVGPYEVTALIGEGGMGKVWRARHTTLKRDDALKVLPEGFATDAASLARFERSSVTRYVEPYAVAVAYAGLGDSERAISLLSRAFDERSVWWAMFARCDPRLDALRADARLQELFRRMRFDR
jgi:serine/threonine-protein kinase